MGDLQKRIDNFKEEVRQSFYNGKRTRVVLNEWVGFKEEDGKLQKKVEEMRQEFPMFEREVNDSKTAYPLVVADFYRWYEKWLK